MWADWRAPGRFTGGPYDRSSPHVAPEELAPGFVDLPFYAASAFYSCCYDQSWRLCDVAPFESGLAIVPDQLREADVARVGELVRSQLLRSIRSRAPGLPFLRLRGLSLRRRKSAIVAGRVRYCLRTLGPKSREAPLAHPDTPGMLVSPGLFGPGASGGSREPGASGGSREQEAPAHPEDGRESSEGQDEAWE